MPFALLHLGGVTMVVRFDLGWHPATLPEPSLKHIRPDFHDRLPVKLSEVLPSAAVLLDLDGLSKWALIERLADALVQSEQINAANRDEVHEALVARERSMSTGMEKGIAIPHASVASAAQTAVALGISREGVAFEAIDGQPTNLVILLVNPNNQTKTHIRTLAEIARLLSNADLRTSLRGAQSSEDVLEMIRSAEAAVA